MPLRGTQAPKQAPRVRDCFASLAHSIAIGARSDNLNLFPVHRYLLLYTESNRLIQAKSRIPEAICFNKGWLRALGAQSAQPFKQDRPPKPSPPSNHSRAFSGSSSAHELKRYGRSLTCRFSPRNWRASPFISCKSFSSTRARSRISTTSLASATACAPRPQEQSMTLPLCVSPQLHFPAFWIGRRISPKIYDRSIVFRRRISRDEAPTRISNSPGSTTQSSFVGS
jgi:hypothetical protein